ncbi:MAG: Hint domain-containing protein, partial [Pseudomonadota bacterium]
NNGSNALPQDTIATPPCFTPGTFVESRQGPVRVERLRPGDEVWTLDHGWQALSWVGHCDVSADLLAANPQLTPVRIARGAFGPNQPNRDMLVSPQHRILVRHPAAELVTGEEETLVAALHLVGMPGVSRAADADWVTYIHLQCAAHEVLSTDGLLTESYNPGAETAGAFNATAQAELYALFPHLAAGSGATLDAARRVLKRHEARILHHAIAA